VNIVAIKDLLAIAASFALVTCLIQMRKFRKTLALETEKRLFPNLSLELDEKELQIYVKNDSFFLAQNIKFQDSELILDDMGFKVCVIIKFEDIGVIKPQERVKLNFKCFDKKLNFLPELTERAIPHLINAPFTVKIFLSNIENMKFGITINRSQRKFTVERIEFFPP